jgi:hypothetical protein
LKLKSIIWFLRYIWKCITHAMVKPFRQWIWALTLLSLRYTMKQLNQDSTVLV